MSRVTFDEGLLKGDGISFDLLALDQALDRLRELDERGFKVVTLRFFGGFELDEVAKMLAISVRTVKRDWTLCRAWLRMQLKNEAQH